MTKVKVNVKFLDKFDNSIVYAPGSVIEIADEARVKDLTSRGLVEVVGNEKGSESQIFGTIDLSKPAKEVIEAVASETDTENLTLALEAENAGGKPRTTVVGTINDRIAELSE